MDAKDLSPAEDSLTALEKLKKYSGCVPWSYLAPHYKAGALLYVDACLELEHVGLALTEDNAAQIQAWMHSGDLVKPCALHCQHWEASHTEFQAMIVRPFVLAQALPAGGTAYA
jgi:hypothetical protein